MKKILLSAALIAVSFTGFAQVGVGTTTPSAALDVVSTGNSDTTYALEINNGSGKEMLKIHDTGKLFFGGGKLADLPYAYDFNIVPVTGSSSTPDLAIWKGDGTRSMVLFNGTTGGGIQLMGATNNGTIFFNGAANATSYINNGGKLGIGTTSPANELDVNGKVNVRDLTTATTATDVLVVASATTGELKGSVTIASLAAPVIWEQDATNTITKMSYLSNGTTARSANTSFVATDAGYVGIGTDAPSNMLTLDRTQGAMLEIKKSGDRIVLFGDTGSSDDGNLLMYNSGGGGIAIKLSSSSNSYISDNLGLGRTAAVSKLDVNGAVRVASMVNSTATEGMIQYSTDPNPGGTVTGNHFWGYNGTSWVQLDN